MMARCISRRHVDLGHLGVSVKPLHSQALHGPYAPWTCMASGNFHAICEQKSLAIAESFRMLWPRSRRKAER